MNWFSFEWLKSDERKEFEALKRENAELKAKLQEVATAPVAPPPVATAAPVGVFKKAIFSNGVLTVITHQDISLSKMNVDMGFVSKVQMVSSEKELFELMTDPVNIPKVEVSHKVSDEEKALVHNSLDILREHDDFIVSGNTVKMRGVALEIPEVIAASFIEILEKEKYGKIVNKATITDEVWVDTTFYDEDNDEYVEDGFYDEEKIELENLNANYEALKMFWLKMALNPLAQSREDLLTFVRLNDVRITPNGNLVLYRRIVSLEKTDKKFTEFISQQYFRIKGNKKSPKNYEVFEVGNDAENLEYILGNSISDAKVQSWNTQKHMGNLYDLYVELPSLDGNIYTSAHNRGKLTIKIGSIYRIPDDEINLDNGICAGGGLHAASVNYNYSGFGDTPVVVLLNPSKAITVPVNETGKLRTTEMFVAAVNDKPHGVHWDDSELSAFDEEYHDLSMEELEEAVSKRDFTNLSVSGNTPELTYTNVRDIAELMRKRVQTIV